MLLKNTSRRLITINLPKDPETGKLPEPIMIKQAGASVEVPDAICKTPFVRHMIKIGDLVNDVVIPDEIEEEIKDVVVDEKVDLIKSVKKMSKTDLIAFADEQGIEFDEEANKETILEIVLSVLQSGE